MNEMMQDEECLATQTQGCCEGGRRPFSERKELRAIRSFGECLAEMQAEDAIAEGTDALLAERGNTYGPPEVNLHSTAQMWEAYDRNREPGRPEGFLDVCYKNILQKMSRLARTPTHQDSQEDVIGYMKMAIEYVEANYSGQIAESVK